MSTMPLLSVRPTSIRRPPPTEHPSSPPLPRLRPPRTEGHDDDLHGMERLRAGLPVWALDDLIPQVCGLCA